jgi:predicted flavoprotein YhiN
VLGAGAPHGGSLVAAALRRRGGLPSRLVDALLTEAAVPPGRKISELRRAERAALLEALTAYQLAVTGHEGYLKAEVTGGGVALDEIDCGTMQSRKMPGVHLCGELCDVHGRIGGFNFFWAWCSGRLAGLGAAAAAAGAAGATAAGGSREGLAV